MCWVGCFLFFFLLRLWYDLFHLAVTSDWLVGWLVGCRTNSQRLRWHCVEVKKGQKGRPGESGNQWDSGSLAALRWFLFSPGLSNYWCGEMLNVMLRRQISTCAPFITLQKLSQTILMDCWSERWPQQLCVSAAKQTFHLTCSSSILYSFHQECSSGETSSTISFSTCETVQGKTKTFSCSPAEMHSILWVPPHFHACPILLRRFTPDLFF